MSTPTDLSHMTEDEIRDYIWSDVPPCEPQTVPLWAANQIVSLTHVSGELQGLAFEVTMDSRDEQ